MKEPFLMGYKQSFPIFLGHILVWKSKTVVSISETNSQTKCFYDIVTIFEHKLCMWLVNFTFQKAKRSSLSLYLIKPPLTKQNRTFKMIPTLYCCVSSPSHQDCLLYIVHQLSVDCLRSSYLLCFIQEMDLVQMKQRGKRRTKGALITPDSKLLFVIRIGG